MSNKTLTKIIKALNAVNCSEISRASGVSRSTIHNIKSGRNKNPTLEIMLRICAYLGVKNEI